MERKKDERTTVDVLRLLQAADDFDDMGMISQPVPSSIEQTANNNGPAEDQQSLADVTESEDEASDEQRVRVLARLAQAVEADQAALLAVDLHDHDTRQSLLQDLGQKFLIHYSLTGVFPSLDTRILDRHIAASIPEKSRLNPERAAFLFGLSGALEQKYDLDNELTDLEEALLLTYEAMEATMDQHPHWEAMASALRARQRRWAARTGKMPDTEIATLLWRKGGRWVPPELSSNAEMHAPFYVRLGDLDASPEEAAKQPVVQCMTAPAESEREKMTSNMVQIV